MGALINIDYDSQIVSTDQAKLLATNIQSLVADVMGEKDAFVYANAKTITTGSDPIEVFVQVNQQKITDPASLLEQIATELGSWKVQANFEQPINLNVMPVIWHSKIGL